MAIYRTIYRTKFEGMDHQSHLDLSDLLVHIGPHCLPIYLNLSILKIFATEHLSGNIFSYICQHVNLYEQLKFDAQMN